MLKGFFHSGGKGAVGERKGEEEKRETRYIFFPSPPSLFWEGERSEFVGGC